MTLDKLVITENKPVNRLFLWCVVLSAIAHGVSFRWLPAFQGDLIQVPMPQVMEVRLVSPVAETPIQSPHKTSTPALHQVVKPRHVAVTEPVIRVNNPEASRPASAPVPETIKEDIPAKTEISPGQPSPSPMPVEVVQPLIEAKPDYLSNPRPSYPLAARRMGLEGKVVLHVEVLQNGTCGNLEIKISSGYDILDQAAMKAVRGWRFTPAKLGDMTRTAWVDIPVLFSLDEVGATR